jgi:hypothetical protein
MYVLYGVRITACISPYTYSNTSFSIVDMVCVLCKQRTESPYKIEMNVSLQNIIL